jgi:IS5 family transposase
MSRNPYELGVKVGTVNTLKGTLIVGPKTLPENPYDGHALNEKMEQSGILIQAAEMKPETA